MAVCCQESNNLSQKKRTKDVEHLENTATLNLGIYVYTYMYI